ncbi:MAG: signal peptidase I [Methylococcales bacterium]|nr:signal peptidase I [Methylococcales bacterium]MBT7445869.1 signal peptidase I [Methylococcales bacterium]
MDFALILVPLVAVTGAIWLIDTLFFAKQRQAKHLMSLKNSINQGQEPIIDEPWFVGFSKSLFPVFLIVLVLRSFVMEPFRIPSNSMMPTLLTGDFIVVNKFAYGIRLPVVNLKLLDIGDPQRGDVIVFRYPKNPSQNFIKRVVGLPGDHIAYLNKKVFVNNELAPQVDSGKYVGVGKGAGMTGALLKEETLGNVTHNILVRSESPDRSFEFDVPEGHYFVLGDNRDRSHDSRYWGAVPDQNLVGRAFMIWMNWDEGISWERIGQSIK